MVSRGTLPAEKKADNQDTLNAPTVSLPESADQNATYIVFMIDQDVPRNGTTFTLLHWFQPSLQRTATNASLAMSMIENGRPSIEGAPYIPPTPPGGSGPHRYTILLYTEPDNFTLPAQYSSISPPESSSARIGFNLTSFAEAAGLGAPIAANYLRVLNGTEAETSSAATITGTSGVAPTEQPTIVASTTNSAAASSASTSGNNSPSDATTGGEASATGSSSTPSQTASGAGPIGVGKGSFSELVMGLALAVVGAGMWMA